LAGQHGFDSRFLWDLGIICGKIYEVCLRF